MAVRTPAQLARRRRIEWLIGLAAPALDLLLFAGHHVSRVAGRNETEPEPPRRSAAPGTFRPPLQAGAKRPGPSS